MSGSAEQRGHLGEEAGAQGGPEGKGGSRDTHHSIGKLAGHCISQPLHRGGAGLGCLHQPQDVSNCRLVATADCAYLCAQQGCIENRHRMEEMEVEVRVESLDPVKSNGHCHWVFC